MTLPWFDRLRAEIAARGLRVNNLFETHSGGWQANLTDGEAFYGFGLGESAESALAAALAKAPEAPEAVEPTGVFA